ncbi:MAG: tetratricopeptide repeat protein [Chloroflexota bacterium]|nr:tetratricopeptide repeat protein [Chloroflexota bacterium]
MVKGMNSTKLGTFCDKILEIAWLVAVIITPLFFNVYSSRVFEPDKLTALRTVAVIMAAVWLVKYIEERTSGRREIRLTWRTPLVFPTLFMVVVYLLSTILSVTRWVSLFGSYQRLQGTYTTLAYIVVFLVILQGLRTRAQLDRLIGVIIINSLPISLYGLVQRNGLDPLPWGGDVTRRVASNMGNAIFVAAYLIMVVPLTIGRIIESFKAILTDDEANGADVIRAACYIFTAAVQLITIWYTQSRGPLMGLLAGLGVFAFMGLLALQRAARQERPFHPSDILGDLGRGSAFGLGGMAVAGAAAAILYFISKAVVVPESSIPQWVAIIGAGLILSGLWLAFIASQRGWRWLWISALLIAIIFVTGFLAINLVEPVHEWSRNQPWLGRLDDVLQHEGGTGRVRDLIWEGGLQLILPHEPIQYPPTRAYPEGHPDFFNTLRPLVGYGPEAMYVAYNPFYPPLLGHHEARTASPDRSHNETLDSLIITGLLGFIAYLWIFVGVFTFGLRWMGILPSDWRRTTFFVLLAIGAVATVAVTSIIIAPHFFGLAIPVGIVAGLVLYLIVYGFSTYWEPEAAPKGHPHLILLISILSASVAHLVEINFGIAIASTRTTFWAYAGMFVVAGLGLVRKQETEPQEQEAGNKKHGSKHRKKRRKAVPPPPAKPTMPAWLWPTIAIATVGGFIIGTLGFDFVTNAERLSQPMTIIWRALTVLPAQESRTSYGALMIFVLTWLTSAFIFISEMVKGGAFRERRSGDVALAIVLYLLISLAIGFGLVLVLTSRQASLLNIQARALEDVITLEDVIGVADSVAGLLSTYYGFIVFVLVAGGVALFLGTERLPRQNAQPWGVLALTVLIVLAGAISVVTNLRPIQADIVYKQAVPYDQSGQWLVAIEHYKHAIELAPREDFYYLYLGRSYLEYASTIEDTAVRDNVMRMTEQTLIQALELNPLNTDHSRNLAKMYMRWIQLTPDTAKHGGLAQQSTEHFRIATMLSPNNADLWNEWAGLYQFLGDFAMAGQTLQKSLAVDKEYYVTWLIYGDVSLQSGDSEKAAQCYEEALKLEPGLPQVWRMLGSVYAQLGRLDEAVAALHQALELGPEASDAWDTHRMLAIIYTQSGHNDVALPHAQMALQLAPEDQQAMLQDLIAQIQSLDTQ